MLFSRFHCELKGKKLVFASVLRFLYVSATPRAGALKRARRVGRLRAPSAQVLCAHWDSNTNRAGFLSFLSLVPVPSAVPLFGSVSLPSSCQEPTGSFR